MFEITEEPIAVDALYDQVSKNSNGAVVTFCGVVRDHSGDKRTDYLVYDAYEEMAEKKMAEIKAQRDQDRAEKTTALASEPPVEGAEALEDVDVPEADTD